jgi:hypothetical protein
MPPEKAHKLFTLYRKETQTGPVWYVRFWNETTKHYAVTRSTGIHVEGKNSAAMKRKKPPGKCCPGFSLRRRRLFRIGRERSGFMPWQTSSQILITLIFTD